MLIDLCKKLNIGTRLIESAREINKKIVFELAEKIVNRLKAIGKNVNSSKIFIMGFCFKGDPETSDTRFSTSFDLVNYLRQSCSNLYGFDSVASRVDIESAGVISCSIKEGFENADVVVIMNSHKSHRNLNIRQLSEKSKKSLIFVDCWNLYNKQEIAACKDVIYSSIGLY